MNDRVEIPLSKKLLDDQETLLQTIRIMSERPMSQQDFPATQKLHRDLNAVQRQISIAVSAIYSGMVNEDDEDLLTDSCFSTQPEFPKIGE